MYSGKRGTVSPKTSISRLAGELLGLFAEGGREVRSLPNVVLRRRCSKAAGQVKFFGNEPSESGFTSKCFVLLK